MLPLPQFPPSAGFANTTNSTLTLTSPELGKAASVTINLSTSLPAPSPNSNALEYHEVSKGLGSVSSAAGKLVLAGIGMSDGEIAAIVGLVIILGPLILCGLVLLGRKLRGCTRCGKRWKEKSEEADRENLLERNPTPEDAAEVLAGDFFESGNVNWRSAAVRERLEAHRREWAGVGF